MITNHQFALHLRAGLQFLVQDYVSETDGGILHEQAPSESYFEANNMAADVLRLDARSLLEQRVCCCPAAQLPLPDSLIRLLPARVLYRWLIV